MYKRQDMGEEPEDRAQRVAEDVALRERLAATPAGTWRWGCLLYTSPRPREPT